jgi:hypothetical protein
MRPTAALLLATLLPGPFLAAAETPRHRIVQQGNLLLVSAPASSGSLPRAALAQRLTVDFQGVGFAEVADTLRRMTGLAVVVAPRVLASNATLTLTATHMELGNLLGWIRTVGRIHVGWRDGALFLSDQPAAAAGVITVYDVSDLTMTIPDFPGPELDLAGRGDGHGAFTAVRAPEARPAPDAADLADLIERVLGD